MVEGPDGDYEPIDAMERTQQRARRRWSVWWKEARGIPNLVDLVLVGVAWALRGRASLSGWQAHEQRRHPPPLDARRRRGGRQMRAG
jgi:hypothetical protein